MQPMQPDSVAWINGRVVPFASAAVPVWDLGVVAGASVTEMARTYGFEPFRLDRHLRRFTESLTELGFPQPYSARELTDAARTVVQKNVSRLPSGSDLGIVFFSTAGSNATYLAGVSDRTTTVVHTFELPFSMWKASVCQGVRLRIPTMRQLPSSSFPVSLKVRNRLHWWLADREAARIDPGSRALLLDDDGFVTETSTSCFFVVHAGKILTSDRGVLRSLSSEIVEELALSLEIPFERRALTRPELDIADEAFVSSTPSGIFSVSHIDGHKVGNEVPGSVYRRLISAWEHLTGTDPAQQILSFANGSVRLSQ